MYFIIKKHIAKDIKMTKKRQNYNNQRLLKRNTFVKKIIY